jgi:hypothetical protein
VYWNPSAHALAEHFSEWWDWGLNSASGLQSRFSLA